jgi:hypothetical protein
MMRGFQDFWFFGSIPIVVFVKSLENDVSNFVIC